MTRVYDEPVERGRELFRLGVPLLLQQDATPNPISFMVWYEHVAGRNVELSREIEALTANGDAWTTRRRASFTTCRGSPTGAAST